MLGFFAFLMRKDPMMPIILGCVIATVVVIYAVLRSNRTVSFIARHPKAIRITGFVILLAAVPAFLSIFFVFPHIRPDSMLVTGGFLAVMVLASLLVTLPRSAKYAIERKSAEKTSSRSDLPKSSFNGIREGLASIGFVSYHWRAFLLIAGFWAVAFALVPLIAAQIAAYKTGEISGLLNLIPAKSNSAAAVAALLGYALISLISLPIVAVAWHRYVSTGALPRFGIALPARGVLRYLFRLWVFGVFVGTIDKLLGSSLSDLSAYFGQQLARTILDVADYAFWALAIWLFSNLALLLPAAALGDRNMDVYKAAQAMRFLGRTYRVGLLVALLPGAIASILLNELLQRVFPASISIEQLYLIGPSFLYFASITAAATYLSRAYSVATSAINGNTSDGTVLSATAV